MKLLACLLHSHKRLFEDFLSAWWRRHSFSLNQEYAPRHSRIDLASIALPCLVLLSAALAHADWIHPITNPGVAVDSISRFLVVRDTVQEKRLGWQILSLGDITGDGCTDVLLCREEGNVNIPNNAYTVHGGTPPDSHFVAEYTHFLTSLNYIGDVNGDGFVDFGMSRPGDGYEIYWGGPNFDDSIDFLFPHHTSFPAQAADLDADGLPELPLTRTTDGGPVELFRMGHNPDTMPEYIIQSYDSLLFHSNQVVTGDLNGDHYPDLVIADMANIDTAVIHFYWGGPDFDTVADFEIKSTAFWFGYHMLYIPDFNGDGYSDIFIGGDGMDAAGIYYGGPNFDGKMDLVTNVARVGYYYYGIQSYDLAGDINHDGYMDLIFGHDVWSAALYEVHIYLGGPTTETIRYSDIYFTDYDVPQYQPYYGSAWLGHKVAGIGDFNGDGIDDIAVRSQTADGGPGWWGEVNFFAGWNDHPTDVPYEQTTLPTLMYLYQNYPNPFNPSTTIAFDLPRAEKVSLVVYNLLGQEVAKVVDHLHYSPGVHEVTWDGEGMASGVYLYRVEAGTNVACRKMLLVK